ncbi:protein mono-ADP-ribosyltransferase PARP14-like isoform X2 [Ciona intestinalis]
MQMANQQQAKSIAFPALCCGQGGGKPEDCISIMIHEIASYLRLNNSSIEEVHLVELNRDNVLKCFHNEVLRVCVSSIPQPTNQASNQCTIPQITVIEKDITQQKADVIVNSTTSFAVNSVDGSALSRAIRDAAGKKLQVECNAIPQASKCTWGVVATKGYNLPCKNIHHAMIAGWDFSDETTSRSHVKRVVAKCLEMATTDGHTSIAFPPIGCGGFNIPPYVLAEVIQEEVNAIGSSTSLQNIYIVVHPSQPELTKVFEQKLSKSSGNVSQIYGNLNVEVCCGSIEEQHDDVIINSVTTSMDLMKSGKLSQSMVIKGGFVIKRQFHDMKRKYASPTIRVTDGGRLPCDVIIHGATSKLGIQELVTESLKIAEEMGKSTVAIPALGTGAMGKPPLECAKLIKQGIIKFAIHNPVHVKNVKVVVFQNDMVAEFKSNLLSNSSVAPSTTSSDVVTFYLCGLSKADVDHAKGKLEDVIRKEEEVNEIPNPYISKLDAEFEKDIILLNQKNVEVNVNKSKGIIEVRGVAKFSKKASIDVQNILGESTQAETLRERVQWQYCLQGSNSFENFGLRHNMQLEKSFKVKHVVLHNAFQCTFVFFIQNDNNGKLTVSGLSIDFSSETGHLNNSAIQIFRKDLQKNFPSTWLAMRKGENCATPKVSESSQEYKDVKQKFITAGTPIKTVQQYGQFQSKRDEVMSELNANGLSYPPTRELFHGTTSDITEKICKEGFNRSYAGANGIRFGKGMYFAVKSSYCHERNFAMPDNNNVRRMFLVEVATGEYAPEPGNESMITPPVRNPSSKTDSYHSVVDNPKSPEVFVVFKDACAYPHYLLTYT